MLRSWQPEEEVDQWTTGYMHSSEIIFVLRGLVAGQSVIARKRWNQDYHREHIWAASDHLHVREYEHKAKTRGDITLT